MSSIFVVSSFEDLAEWDGIDTLAFADGDKLAFGAGSQLDLYSDGIHGYLTMPDGGGAGDPPSNRHELRFESFDLIAGVITIPLINFNPASIFAKGVGGFMSGIRLIGLNPQMAWFDEANPLGNFVNATFTSATGLLEMKGPGTSQFRIGATGEKFSIVGATPQAQKTHIVPADGTLADLTAKFNALLIDLESFGFHSAT